VNGLQVAAAVAALLIIADILAICAWSRLEERSNENGRRHQ
jgi:hypothetical protein